MYTVYGMRMTRTFRVLWMLEELGVPYQHVPAAPRSTEITAVNTSGKVPALAVGDQLLTDSMAKLRYHADKQDNFTAPAGTIERARQEAWTFRILDEVEGLLWAASRHSYILPEGQRVPAVLDAVKTEFAASIERLGADFGGPYLMGDEVTVPDFLLAHCLGWARNAKFPDAPEMLVDYARRLRDRPAFQRAAAL